MKKQNARLTHRITIRMDDALYNLITENAKQAGLSQVEYARRTLLHGKVFIKREIIADVPELKRFIAQFAKIGSTSIKSSITTMAAVCAPGKCTTKPCAPFPSSIQNRNFL